MPHLPPPASRGLNDILGLLDSCGIDDLFILEKMRSLASGFVAPKGVHAPTMFRALLVFFHMRRLIGYESQQVGTQIMIVLPSPQPGGEKAEADLKHALSISARLAQDDNADQTLNKLLANPKHLKHLPNNQRAKPRPKRKKRIRDL